jgi:competence protein ComEC
VRTRPPIDARLAVPAAGAWAGAAIGCGVARGVALWLLAGALVLLVGSLLLRRPALAAGAGGVGLGCLSALVHLALVQSGPVAGAARSNAHGVVTMRLVRDPQPRQSAHGLSYQLADATVDALDGRRAHAPVLVIAHGGGWTGLLPGQRLRVKARLSPPRSGDGITAVVLASAPPQLLGHPPWWQRAAGAVRERLRTACARLPPDERGLVPGLVVGDVSQMPPSLTDAFRTSGLTHLNAVSGENVAIVLATIGALLRRTPLPRGWRYVVAAAGLAGFVVLARPSPSVLRAAVMGATALAAGLAGRRSQPLPLLSAAVMSLVLVDPFLGRAPGFALSVLATAAIVLTARPLADRLSRRMPRALAVAIAVPTVAQLACTPVLVAVFGQLTPWAIPANLLAAPAVAPATVIGVSVAVIATVTPAVAGALALLAALPAAWLAVVARGIAALPGADARPSWLVGVTTMALVVAVVVWRVRSSSLRAMLGTWPP